MAKEEGTRKEEERGMRKWVASTFQAAKNLTRIDKSEVPDEANEKENAWKQRECNVSKCPQKKCLQAKRK